MAVGKNGSIFVLYTAGAFEWRRAGSYATLESLKRELVDHYGFSEEIMTDDALLEEELDGYEMKYEEVPLP